MRKNQDMKVFKGAGPLICETVKTILLTLAIILLGIIVVSILSTGIVALALQVLMLFVET